MVVENIIPDHIQPQPTGYLLYFGCPNGACHEMPVGGTFDVVDTQTWRKIRWQVRESIEKYGKNKGEWSRFYRPIMSRDLDADECAVYQQIIEDWVNDSQQANASADAGGGNGE